MADLDTITNILEAAQPYTYVTEDDLQRDLTDTLTTAGIPTQREVRLSDGISRIDLLADRIGIEVKIKGTWIDVARQLRRYVASPDLDGLILVTTRAAHNTPALAEFVGQVRVISLVGGAL